MGGRGAASGTVNLPASVLDELPYTVISFDDERGGAVYPFLERTGRAWRILSRPVEAEGNAHPAHTFGQDAPTLRWVNGDQVRDLYVDGMSTDEFLAASGLQLGLEKGAFVLSKRLSRLMRPHFVSRFFDPQDVTVAYIDQSPSEAKVWDGAALISRRMLNKLALDEEVDLSPAKRAWLEQELQGAQRVEFTVMTPAGQDKGHAIVSDDLRDADGRPVDFLLPRDTKGELRLKNGQTFVGLSVVHGHNHMRLDIQSLINLHPFFSEEQLLSWLGDEGDLFVQSVESGEIAEVMGRIDPHTPLEDIQAWPLREYLASGGHPMWFRSHVKSLMNQHLMRLNHTTLEKMRLPIPGGRHYVMPAAVGQRAGIEGLDVPRGQVRIDAGRSTAWVNDEDWLALADSPTGDGIADILGGADNDDALWLHPFTDADGARKVLAWRSPNQVGEYVILEPTADSDALGWTKVAGDAEKEVAVESQQTEEFSFGDLNEKETVYYPVGDSHALPPRVDFTETTYLGLVDPEPAGGTQGESYSVDVMDAAIERAIANQGALGMYCNALMVNKGVFGRLPDEPPAPLEDIVDGAVKTGADLSRVIAWNYENSRRILESQTPIPSILQRRLSIDWSDRENRPPPVRSTRGLAGQPGHWLDRLEDGIRGHVREIELRRDELVAQARPPQWVLDAATPETIQLGAGLNKAYAAALRMGKGEYSSALERAKVGAEDYLAHFPPHKQGDILLGALASVYGDDEVRSDTAVWLAGRKTELSPSEIGLGNFTIVALRKLKILNDVLT